MSKGGQAQDAQDRYDRAFQLAAAIREAWEELDCPLTTTGGATGRSIVPHPLVKMLAEAERDAARFAKELRPAHSGQDPKAVLAPKIGRSPRQKLRSVK